MEENPKILARKQRQKNQRYKNKPQEKQGESVSPNSVNDNSSNPQPQRTNRRQRNDAVAPAVNNVTDSATTASKENNEAVEKENVTIDFSNLKRETEEIAKLTKKFSKRNISSNWHRYSAPEGTADEEKAEEEAPADFSALIQVPASKGGHLQLKDEQEWSSASGDQLGGYFALNLKLLSQSLACVPIYEQLRLPKHIFTEEELQHLDSLAGHATKVYNPDKFEDPKTKVRKTLISLLEREPYVEEPEIEKDTKTDNVFNILDIHSSNQKLLNIELQKEILPENSPVGNNVMLKNRNKDSFEKVNLPFNIKENEDPIQKKNNKLTNDKLIEGKDTNNLSTANSYTENETFETEKIDVTKEKTYPYLNTQSKSLEELPDSLTQSSIVHKNTEGVDKVVIKTSLSENYELKKEIPINTSKEIGTSNFNPESSVTSEPKEKRTKNNRKKSITDSNESKQCNKENNLNIEDDDDDDLDFLLSLNKRTPAEKEKYMKYPPNKDSTFLPGNKTSPQTSSTKQHSELDDWLDSMLKD